MPPPTATSVDDDAAIAAARPRIAALTGFDELTFIGSNNLDPFSLHLNSETVVAVWSRAVAGQTQATLAARRDHDMVEYRVARDIRGDVLRKLAATPGAGGVVVAWGPVDHVPGDQLPQLRALQWLLIAQRRLWDSDVLVW